MSDALLAAIKAQTLALEANTAALQAHTQAVEGMAAILAADLQPDDMDQAADGDAPVPTYMDGSNIR